MIPEHVPARSLPIAFPKSKEVRAAIEMHRRSGLVMDEDDGQQSDIEQAERRGSLKTLEWIFRGLRLLAQYEGNRDMALDCFLLAHGKGEFVGLETAVQVAEKHFQNAKKKAAVTKCIKLFQDCLDIPPMPGQRDPKGCTAMKNARNGQLT